MYVLTCEICIDLCVISAEIGDASFIQAIFRYAHEFLLSKLWYGCTELFLFCHFASVNIGPALWSIWFDR